MDRRKFTREFKLEAVRLIQERGDRGASLARFGGAWRCGQMKPELAEIARLIVCFL